MAERIQVWLAGTAVAAGAVTAFAVTQQPGPEKPLPDPTNIEAQYFPGGTIPSTTEGYTQAHDSAVSDYRQRYAGEIAGKTPQARMSAILGAYCRAAATFKVEAVAASDIASNNQWVKTQALEDVYTKLHAQHKVPALPAPPNAWEYQDSSVPVGVALQDAAHDVCPTDIPIYESHPEG